MRKLRALTALIALLLLDAPMAAFADQPAALSLPITSTTGVQVKTGTGVFWGATSAGVQTNALSCYNNTSATGTPLWTGILSSVGANITGLPPGGIAYTVGLFCVVPTAIVTSVSIWYN
jgi:hypothetical protein